MVSSKVVGAGAFVVVGLLLFTLALFLIGERRLLFEDRFPVYMAGSVIGAGLGVLLAPRAGSETRGAIGERARHLSDMASDQYQKASDSANDWAERGREFVDKARDAVSRGADDAREYVAGVTGTTGSGGDFGRS